MAFRFAAVRALSGRCFGHVRSLASSSDASEAPAAVVTGACGGIGRAIASRLHSDGFRVLCVDLNDGSHKQENLFHFCADLTREESNEAAVREARKRFGRVDLVVANAGVQHVCPIRDFPLEKWRELMALNLTSPFLLAKHAWDDLARSGRGRFVAISSAHGLVASPFKSAYVASKHGVVGLVKSLALEGAEHGVCATALCPGYVRTPLVEKQIASQAAAHSISESKVLSDVILSPHVIKRMIEPEEVAEVVSLLAGPLGEAFTGCSLPMDMGWTCR